MQIISIPENIFSISELIQEFNLFKPEKVYIFLFSSANNEYTLSQLSILLQLSKRNKKIELFFSDTSKDYDFIAKILKIKIIPAILIIRFGISKILTGLQSKDDLITELNKKPHYCYFCKSRGNKVKDKVQCKKNKEYMNFTDNCYGFR